ncbi:MAG: hypothetical protein ACFFE8_13965 [Candidatus Heimdallarchaeota archaeon]
MSEPVKYTYRGLGGFFVFLFLSVLVIIGGGLLVLGTIVLIISWAPVSFPDFLDAFRIFFLGRRIVDPNFAVMLIFITGLTLVSVGIITLGFAFYVYRAAQVVEQDLAQAVDMNLPSIRKLFSVKAKGILLVSIMLFGTLVVFFVFLFS